ncbi:MAG: gluconokinase [Flavisolibacter sp.]|nr:gluconokinase [Flavisolibacter sp.]
MPPYIIGIDIGTGSTKAVAVTKTGTVIATAQVAYTTQHPKPDYSEQNPEEIWQAFSESIKSIVEKVNQSPSAISLSSAMHSLTAIDAEGKLLMPLVTWSDTRSEELAVIIRSSDKAEEIYRDTGAPLHAMTPLCKIVWLKQNQPSVVIQAFKFISIKEYIWFKLFQRFQVDYSIACASGLFSIHERDWSPLALSTAGIQKQQLSEPVPTEYMHTGMQPAIADLLTIPSDTPFCIGASDGCLANLGSFAIEKGVAAVTIGTSGAVRIASAVPLLHYQAMLFSYILDHHTFICGGPINNGGNVLQWLLRQFLQKKAEPGKYQKVFTQIDRIPPGSAGLIFLPYLYGERAPVWDEKSCGVFFGIRQQHTEAHFLRAALEGVCFAIKEVLQKVEQFSGSIHQMQVSGGFVHSATWVKLMADITGKRLCLVQTEDASALGAAFLTMKEMNWITDYTSLKPDSEMFIDPEKELQRVYEKNFGVFQLLYPQLKEVMHQLSS